WRRSQLPNRANRGANRRANRAMKAGMASLHHPPPSSCRPGDDALAALAEVVGKRPEGGERRVARVAFLEALVDLLDDAGQAEQAVDLVEIEVGHAPARAPGVVLDDLLAREHAGRIGGLAARAQHEGVVVSLNP